ncbi:DUF2059 domain-containing protein [Marivita sp. GX14005]|uniref:DUF2059 domain-containing protein n=1 Tax=Marivita sp. GX14005 TaxID=2942276 RepID=UPI002018D6A7|nr:DUF2059 domain-containing protein [Marivita sp. GX14005]MCL3882570.1 DUF2059 domain-containing protein [Marivita sp. GX14005]
MIRTLTKAAAAGLFVLASAGAGAAQQIDDLLGALGVPQIVEIMRAEGLDYGKTLGDDMLPGGATDRWRQTVDRIYDDARMLETVKRGFAEEFGEADADPLIAFFTSDTGEQIVDLELSARQAMRDEEIEEAARGAYRDLVGTDSDLLETLRDFVTVNDLVEANLVGSLNANYKFYLGLVDGGGIDMSEADILTEVWSSEEDTREDTREWVYAFLLMAYRPLPEGAIEDYTALSETEPGKALNRALFAGFNEMYEDISYALGLAIGRQMQVQEL